MYNEKKLATFPAALPNTCSAKPFKLDLKRAGEHLTPTDVWKHSDIQVMKTYFRKSLTPGVRNYPTVLSRMSFSAKTWKCTGENLLPFIFKYLNILSTRFKKQVKRTHKQWQRLLSHFRLDSNQSWFRVLITIRSSVFKRYQRKYHFKAQRNRKKGCEYFPSVANPPNHFFYSANLTPYALHIDNKVQDFPGRNYVPLN